MGLRKEETVYQLQTVGTCRGLWDSSLAAQLCRAAKGGTWLAVLLSYCVAQGESFLSRACDCSGNLTQLGVVRLVPLLSLQFPMAATRKIDYNQLNQTLLTSLRTVDQPLVFHYKRGKNNEPSYQPINDQRMPTKAALSWAQQ